MKYRKGFAAFAYQHVPLTCTSSIYGIAFSFANRAYTFYYEGAASLDSFIMELTTKQLEENTVTDVVVYNLQFFGWFIVEKMFRSGIPFFDPGDVVNEGAPEPDRYWCCSDIGGKMNGVTLRIDGRKILFRDSEGIFAMKLPELLRQANAKPFPFNTEGVAGVDRYLLPDEKKALSSIILSMYLVSSCYLSGSIKSLSSRAINEFGRDKFEPLEDRDDDLIRRAYSPAILYVNRNKLRQDIPVGWSVDRKSAYAAIIKNELLPCALIDKGTGRPPSMEDDIIATAYVTGKLLPGKFPIMQRSDNAGKVEQLREFETLAYSATGREWKKINENYDLQRVDFCYWWRFKLEKLDTKGYTTLHYNRKEKYKEEGNSAAGMEKRMLTNIVGKFGAKRTVYKTVPQPADKRIAKAIRYEYDEKTGELKESRRPIQGIYASKGDRVFLPAAVYINSYQRLEMVRIMEENAGRVIYCDTDGLLIEGKDSPRGARRGKGLGYYEVQRVQHIFVAAPKVYQYIVEETGELEQAAAGLNVRVDLSKIQPGEKVRVKIAQRCNGGARIVEAEKVVIPIE